MVENLTTTIVVSKCALTGRKKASLVQREVARQRRDGGIVKAKNQSKNNPSAAFGVSSLYTREPKRNYAEDEHDSRKMNSKASPV